MRIQHFLAKPFPQEDSLLDTFKIVSAISLFVFLFLYIFQPFGLHQIDSGLFTLCLGFGVVSFLTSMAYELVIVKVLKFKGVGAKFTFGRWIIYFMGAILCISLANFLFVRLYLFGEIHWALFPYMLRGTFAIGIFPVIVVGALALIQQERKYQIIATEVNQRKTTSPQPLESSATIFSIPIDTVRYIEAMQNYVKIGYIDTDGQCKERSQRATLKSITDQLTNTPLLRCHRSFLVNSAYISSTEGNAQGLLLTLADCNKQVPVSRRYVAAFRENS